jgi:NAD-dependent histone deacetylase SIR2
LFSQQVGAGISTQAGIPDFRTPGTGLYSNLEKLNLPYPEAVFDIDYLRKRPEAFFTLADGLYPGEFEPTKFHRLMKEVADRGYLRRLYTQNIDTLERLVGVDADLIVEAHGSFAENHCIDCGTEMTVEDLKAEMRRDKHKGKIAVPRCIVCGGIVKPDIVFFGEGLPFRFFQCMEEDLPDYADLVIVAGTSLTVHPFARLPDMVGSDTVRVLFNAEHVGSFGDRKNDVLVLGDCDENALRFTKLLGWSADMLQTNVLDTNLTESTQEQKTRLDQESKTVDEKDNQESVQSNSASPAEPGLDKEDALVGALSSRLGNVDLNAKRAGPS